ncbi:MAG: Rieske 2Fe-2S domain-containing protein [Caldilineaceae bacterium]|nr:Rieske 2Fe-2S domain-containing protein [Caldilineaceae bacterium]
MTTLTESQPPATSEAALTRREFLSYAWGAALGALVLEVGLASYFFLSPRFRAGEFGGKFFVAETALPTSSTAPVPYQAGKFWLVNTEEGPKALYMVCTHLGCLYLWDENRQRFDCPCHGSKFSREGYFIYGPAPRSLDSFAINQAEGELVVDTGKKVLGQPKDASPAYDPEYWKANEQG